jgi:hypothetical protein
VNQDWSYIVSNLDLGLRGIQSPGYSKLQIQQRSQHHIAPVSFDESSQSLIFQRVGIGPYHIMLVVTLVYGLRRHGHKQETGCESSQERLEET